jgi:hypothetical protein
MGLNIDQKELAYWEGKQAYHGGIPRRENPYPLCIPEYGEWERGWSDASEVVEHDDFI